MGSLIAQMRIGAWPLAGALLLGMAAPAVQAPAGQAPTDPPAPFHPHTVASGLRGGYQVVAADLNNDGKPDLVALGMQMGELLWFENPYWTPHVITREARRMINLAAADTDRDGIPEIALAYEFSTSPAQSAGKLALLKAGRDPRAPWTLREIDAIPTSHRVRAATVNGRAAFINAPLLNVAARDGFNDPDHLPVPLRVYRPPDFKPETITEENLGVVHGLFVGDWDGDRRDDVLTAGYTGVFVHGAARDGTWTRAMIIAGDPADWPRGGASDVAVGRIGDARLLVTNEPFHGNQVVVYQDLDGTWSRNVIDTTLVNAHSLVLLDSDGDGISEIVSGGTRNPAGTPSGARPGVFFYKAQDRSGQTWSRMVLDADIAANNCVVADFNGDRRADVACIDTMAPWTLRWYENMLPR